MTTLIAILALCTSITALYLAGRAHQKARRAQQQAQTIANLNTRFMRAINATMASRTTMDRLKREMETAPKPDPNWPNREMPEA